MALDMATIKERFEERLKQRETTAPYYWDLYQIQNKEDKKLGLWHILVLEDKSFAHIPVKWFSAYFETEEEARTFVRVIRKEFKLNIKKL